MPATSPLEVVCGIIQLGSRVLAARRDPSRAYPLLWEFPGGKREDGESAEAALHRELEEELRLKVRILSTGEPVHFQHDDFFLKLVPFHCVPAQQAAPVPLDHIELRWVTVDESRQLTWAPADVPLVEKLDNLIKPDNE